MDVNPPTPNTPFTPICIITPFRAVNQPERKKHAQMFLQFIHAKLTECPVIVAEQSNDAQKFNRGALFNAAVTEGITRQWITEDTILCFHDIDMIPEDSLLLEYTHQLPYKMARHIGTIERYKSMGNAYVGGILLVHTRDFLRANGFSSSFWGWGGEDVDFRKRLHSAGVQLQFVRGMVKDLEDMPVFTDKVQHNIRTKNKGTSRASAHPPESGIRNLLFTATTKCDSDILGARNDRHRHIVITLGDSP